MALAAAGLLAGCGALPPQAPSHVADRINNATSTISTACGLASQVTAFPGDHARDLAKLEATAAGGALTLAAVDHRNPDWIYQGQTVAEIVHNSVAYLEDCGLPGSASLLHHRVTGS